MGDKSKIEWTDATWNPIRAHGKATGWHCEKVSPGCQNCYAERLNLRLGTGYEYKRKNRGESGLHLSISMLEQPLRWNKPRRVFVCSMTDLFAEFVPDEWIDRIFAVMALAPQHSFQVLTKRAKRMREWFERTANGADRETIVYKSKPGFSEKGGRIFWPGWPLPNVWLGISAEDQQHLDERVPELLQTPATVRWVSAEPLLGPLGMSLVCGRCGGTGEIACSSIHYEACPGHARGIDWVVVGGESGPGARPCDIAWVRDIVRQCSEAKVACFVKQLGARPMVAVPVELDAGFYGGYAFDDPNGGRTSAHGFKRERGDIVLVRKRMNSSKGGDPSEWPEDLRVREFPGGVT